MKASNTVSFFAKGDPANYSSCPLTVCLAFLKVFSEGVSFQRLKMFFFIINLHNQETGTKK